MRKLHLGLRGKRSLVLVSDTTPCSDVSVDVDALYGLPQGTHTYVSGMSEEYLLAAVAAWFMFALVASLFCDMLH